MNTTNLIQFDMVEQLRTDDDIATYLSMVLADGDSDELMHALGHIAKAKGMTQIAKDSGLGRESLYKALRSGSRPQFDTVLKVLKSLSLDLKVVEHK